MTIVAEIVDTCLRHYAPRENVVLLDGARERIIAGVLARNPQYKSETITAVHQSYRAELDFSEGHPFIGSMFYDMGG